jgi:nucleoside-diphosphate-sugar epimerase
MECGTETQTETAAGMSVSQQRIVLVGGSGFIGTRLCARLSVRPKLDVAIVDKAESAEFPERYRHADVRDLESLSREIPDQAVVVNLAAEHADDVFPRSLYDDVNVGGAKNICAVATARHVRKIVFASSVAVYGFSDRESREEDERKPFNDYGRTKALAEDVYREWQAQDPLRRTLVIVRPTVVFGEGNRGNVYNLLRQISSRGFVMIGSGTNRKSVAYVENVAAFFERALAFEGGVHVYNYVDKPDLSMNELVAFVRELMGKGRSTGLRLPYAAGYAAGIACDVFARATGRKLPVSAIRVRKFCANSLVGSRVASLGFVGPVALQDALRRTVEFEFLGRGTTR